MSDSSSTHAFDQAVQAATHLKPCFKVLPKTAVILGTGLGEAINDLRVDFSINYEEIPHFPISTVQSHEGRFIGGGWSGCPVAVMQGRLHLYEGYSPSAVTFPIRVLQALKIDTLILTNASGGLNPGFRAGDIMIIEDHINLTDTNPLIGPNDDRWGPRFPGMTAAYDPQLAGIVKRIAAGIDIKPKSGVYVGLKGPSLETPAEMRFLRTIGADAVGFSTVMETIAAGHAGMKVLGLSTITNMCLPHCLSDASVAEIIATAESAAPRLGALITGFLNEKAKETN